MNSTLNIGDYLIRQKFLGLVNHVGVFAGNNSVLQNTRDKGEHLATVQEFADGNPVQVVHTGAQPLKVLPKIAQILSRPRKYDLFGRNCEHTATEATEGRARSPQLWIAIIVIVALGVLWFVLRKLLK